jgi:hypothetical protein
MNERIRELINEATSFKEGLIEGKHDIEVFDKEKFAELIIRKCMACSTWVGRVNNNAIEPVHTAQAINQRIKQQFGVER